MQGSVHTRRSVLHTIPLQTHMIAQIAAGDQANRTAQVARTRANNLHTWGTIRYCCSTSQKRLETHWSRCRRVTTTYRCQEDWDKYTHTTKPMTTEGRPKVTRENLWLLALASHIDSQGSPTVVKGGRKRVNEGGEGTQSHHIAS